MQLTFTAGSWVRRRTILIQVTCVLNFLSELYVKGQAHSMLCRQQSSDVEII